MTSIIIIKNNLFDNIHAYLPEHQQQIIIADTNLKIHAEQLQQTLQCEVIYITADEQHKTREYKQQIEDQLFELQCDRHTNIIALGGGITTDFVGFIAATFYRGLPLTLIPTSLLAMVDACIGGKTAVNTPFGKNLIGSFYPAEKVLIDPTVLQTLPKNYFYDGMAEVIKHALLADNKLVELLTIQYEKILTQDNALLAQLIDNNIEIKQQFVMNDEQDKGKRQLLNFGHTIGHALEIASNHELTHGQAVALGMLAELSIGVQQKITPKLLFEQTKQLLTKYHLPVSTKTNMDATLSALSYDKKKQDKTIQCSLLEAIGKPYVKNNRYTMPITEQQVIQALSMINK